MTSKDYERVTWQIDQLTNVIQIRCNESYDGQGIDTDYTCGLCIHVLFDLLDAVRLNSALLALKNKDHYLVSSARAYDGEESLHILYQVY